MVGPTCQQVEHQDSTEILCYTKCMLTQLCWLHSVAPRVLSQQSLRCNFPKFTFPRLLQTTVSTSVLHSNKNLLQVQELGQSCFLCDQVTLPLRVLRLYFTITIALQLPLSTEKQEVCQLHIETSWAQLNTVCHNHWWVSALLSSSDVQLRWTHQCDIESAMRSTLTSLVTRLCFGRTAG